ncbi:MAG: PAS domain-containing protein [Hydrogenophaga sp.]|nr:PAS domain-containing protein [Hydrogenophaga sp.]
MPTFTGSQPPSAPPSPAGRTPAPPAETGPASERQLLHWLTASTIVLLLVGTIAFAWKERQRTLDEAGDVATRRVTRLVKDVEQSLAVARKAIEQAETRLRLRAPDGPPDAWLGEAAADRAALLSTLPLPFELHALDRDGLANDLVAFGSNPSPRAMPPIQHDVTSLPPDRWHVGLTQGPPHNRVIPLIWKAAPNGHGITAYGADIAFTPLLSRLEAERAPNGGGVALFRLEPDGGATVLARAPYVEDHLGQAVDPALAQLLARNRHGVFDTVGQLDGVARRVAFQQLNNGAEQLVIVYGIPTTTVLASWYGQLPYLLGACALLTLAMGYGSTRLSRSLRALSDSEQRFRLAAASGHVWDWNALTRVLDVPIAIWNRLGLKPPPPDRALQVFTDRLHPDDKGPMREALIRHLREHQPFAETFRLLDACGAYRWFETQGQASWNESGEATYMAGTAFEVTERRSLEEAQRQTLHRLDTVANASPALFWTSDQNMRCDWVNQRWLEFTGHRLEEELDDNWTGSLHPDDQARCQDTYDRAFESRQPFSTEFRLLRHDGSYRWMLDQGIPRHDADGHFLGYIGSCVDLTDLKAAEQTALHQRQLLEKIFDVLPDLFFLLDDEGTIIEHLASAESLLYAPPDQFVGKRVHEVMPPEFVTPFMKKAMETRSGQLVRHEYMLPLPDGPHHFEARLARLPGSEQLMAIVRDISDQKRLENERERLNHFVVLLFGLASRFINLPVPQMDAAIHEALGDMGRFVSADRAYLFDYDWAARTRSNTHEWCAEGIASGRAHLRNLPLDGDPDWVATHQRGDVIHVPDVDTMPEGALKAVLQAQGIRSLITLPLMGPDACLGYVGLDSVRLQHRYDDEEIALLKLFAQMLVNLKLRAGAEARIRELTGQLEQKVTERTGQLEASVKRLQAVNRELESFTYSASHDLRTPLRGIEGFSTLLLEEHGTQLDNQGREYLQRIQRATLHMSQLISDLLAYARLEQMTEQVEPVVLAKLVQEVVLPFQDSLNERHGQLQVAVPDHLQVLADPNGLAMVLRNLVDNALKFTPADRAPEIRIEAHEQDGAVHLQVTDRGMGFDMKHHDRVFGMFQRLHRQDQIPGTGIGLAMAHKAVERMGGRIWAHSTPGQGTTFHLELPQG